MAGTRITQQSPAAIPGRRYGSFAGKTSTVSTPQGAPVVEWDVHAVRVLARDVHAVRLVDWQVDA